MPDDSLLVSYKLGAYAVWDRLRKTRVFKSVSHSLQWGTADAEIKPPTPPTTWWEPRAIKGSLFLSQISPILNGGL